MTPVDVEAARALIKNEPSPCALGVAAREGWPAALDALDEAVELLSEAHTWAWGSEPPPVERKIEAFLARLGGTS